MVTILVVTTTTQTPQPEDLSCYRLTFIPQHKIVLTGNSYVVPFLLNTDEVLEPLKDAHELVAQMSWNVHSMINQSVLLRSLKHNFQYFYLTFSKIFKTTVDYFTYLTSGTPTTGTPFESHRGRRGALDIVGSLANTLFGVATEGQVDRIHSSINYLEDLTETERKT